MEIKEIRQKAKEIIEAKEEDKVVGRYTDLLELKRQTEKQLRNIEKAIKKFENDPETFCDDIDELW